MAGALLVDYQIRPSRTIRLRNPMPVRDLLGVWRVPLPRGLFALVDEADLGTVVGANWSVAGEIPYAIRKVIVAGQRHVILMHRAILCATPDQVVDHANHDTLDNRRSNLRAATISQNSANKKACRSASGFRGVRRAKNGYAAHINSGARWQYLGYFSEPEEAARAYDAAALREYGEFAALNFPDERERAG